jgi:DNA-binding NtrC family response regulator
LSNFIMRLTVLYPGRVINLAQVPPGLLSSGMEAIIRSQSIQEMPGSSGEIPTPSARDSSLLEYFDFTADSPGDQPIGAMRLLEATFDDLENRAFFPEGGLHCKSLVERFEIALLKAALREAKQNTKAAKLLCMERTTFIQKLSRYGVDKSEI